ncbi:putative chaperonin [Escherichia coli]|uniref:Putative chaperonin n=1 Tax=Escherichia coli TaxID=562 RepID=A0A376P801_ECOLX|nr:putative chaperonin [Escherichia coli]
MHVYPAHLTTARWCTLDNQGVIYFIDLGEEVITTGGDFVLAKVWAMVMASVARQHCNCHYPIFPTDWQAASFRPVTARIHHSA